MNAAARALDAADYETAISRSYDAAYHAVIAVVEARLGPRQGWAHRIPEYARRTEGLRELYMNLIDLYELRVMADYQDRLSTRDEAAYAIDCGRRTYETAVRLV